jgi:hypothetical protein
LNLKSLSTIEIQGNVAFWLSPYGLFLGTTWTQEMTWLIQTDLDFNGAKVFLPERFPFLE